MPPTQISNDVLPGIQQRINSLPTDNDWGVRATTIVIEAAFALGLSDLHIAALPESFSVRGRRDGILLPLAEIASPQRTLMASRLKVLAQLPAFIKNEPQDGRITWSTSQVNADPQILRISFLPTIHGENIAIRFPASSRLEILALDELGMTEETLDALYDLTRRREGTIILTGPSSSGKTTTMYAVLKHLHEEQGSRLNMLTIEDPVERDLGFAGQVQVNALQGLTFERALRSALRQDPNVLMIGEVRDAETARIAMQAGVSGHLVLTTLHAGRASRVFSRLLSMGVEPYLAASAVAGAVAQRLARRVCTACNSAGCVQCSGTGVAGRIGLFEVCRVTEPLRELMLAKASAQDLAAEAARSQTGDLLKEGRALEAAGVIAGGELDFILAGDEAYA